MSGRVHIGLDRWMAMTPEQRGSFAHSCDGKYVIDINFDDEWRHQPDNSSQIEREEMGITVREQDAWHKPRQSSGSNKV